MRRRQDVAHRARVRGLGVGTAIAMALAMAPEAGATTALTVDGVEVEERSADGFVATYDGSPVGTSVTLRTTSTDAAGAPAASLPITIYRCPATRGARCRTADPAATAGWKAVATGVTDATGAFSAPLELAESGWFAAALDGVPADSAGNADVPAFIGGHSNWSIVRRNGKSLIRVRGELEPPVPVGTAWIVLQVRKQRSGPASTLVRQAVKANGRYTFLVAPRVGSWGYRLAFVGRPKDRYSTSVSDWHRYNHQP
jgi:hypothetical protein